MNIYLAFLFCWIGFWSIAVGIAWAIMSYKAWKHKKNVTDHIYKMMAGIEEKDK